MRVRKSTKMFKGKNCFEVVNNGNVIKVFITKEYAQAFVTENKISSYTKSKSYKKDMAFLNYMSGIDTIPFLNSMNTAGGTGGIDTIV
jgi:hypothetical protein